MKIAPMADVRNNFAKYLGASEREPIFITKNGRIKAVLEFMEDADIEDFLLERSARFRSMLRSVKHEKGGMSLSTYRKSRRI
jgi:hypothetical protein